VWSFDFSLDDGGEGGEYCRKVLEDSGDVRSYLFTPATEAFDHFAAQLQGEGRSWAVVGPSEKVPRAFWRRHGDM